MCIFHLTFLGVVPDGQHISSRPQGLTVQFPLGEPVALENAAIQPEVLFSSQGAKLENAGNESNFKVSYLNIPVMFKYRFNGGFYLEAGPQFGFKLSENIPGANNAENFAKNVDFGVGAGLGFHGKSGLGVGGRYVLGLSKVGDFEENDFADPSFRNGVIQVSLFYTFLNNRDNP